MRQGLILMSFLCAVYVYAVGPERIFSMDPIELVSGSEIEGQEEISLVRHGIRYQFKTEENKHKFERDPIKYEVQMGGACGRMGPLSGEGRPQFLAVHEERIYFFASESCRKRFLESPPLFLDPDEPLPEGDEVSRQKGKALIEKAVTAVGGAERIESVTGMMEHSEEVVESRGEQVKTTRTRAFTYPDTYFREDTWGELNWGMYLDKEKGLFVNNDGSRAMAPAQKRALRRFFQSQPLYVLKSRNQSGFVAVHEGSETIENREADRVSVGFDGMRIWLFIDREDGRILGQSYRGRGPEGWFGSLRKTFTDFQAVEGLNLPTSFHISFDGKALPGKKSMSLVLNKRLSPPKYERAEQTGEDRKD